MLKCIQSFLRFHLTSLPFFYSGHSKMFHVGGDVGTSGFSPPTYCCTSLRSSPAYVSQSKTLVAGKGPVNRMARQVEGNRDEHTGEVSITAWVGLMHQTPCSTGVDDSVANQAIQYQFHTDCGGRCGCLDLQLHASHLSHYVYFQLKFCKSPLTVCGRNIRQFLRGVSLIFIKTLPNVRPAYIYIYI